MVKWTNQLQKLAETFRQNRTLIVLSSIGAPIIYDAVSLIFVFFISDSSPSSVHYALPHLSFFVVNFLLFFLFGYFLFTKAKLYKIRTVIISTFLASLIIIFLILIRSYTSQYESSPYKIPMTTVALRAMLYVVKSVATPAFLGMLIARGNQKKKGIKNGFLVTCLIAAAYVTIIATALFIIFDRIDDESILRVFLLLMTNPFALFSIVESDFHWRSSVIEAITIAQALMPITFIYYWGFITLYRFFSNKKRNSKRVGIGSLYSAAIVLLFVTHIGLALLGQLIVMLSASGG